MCNNLTLSTMLFIEKIKQQVTNSKQISDSEAFISLLKTGECLTKLITLVSIAALDNNKLRYRYLYEVVSADGIGAWTKVIEQIHGTAVNIHILPQFNDEKNQLTANQNKDSWGYKVIYDIYKCKEILTGASSDFNFRIKLKDWFRSFAELRNDHAHNRVSLTNYKALIPFLENSLITFIENFKLFEKQWLYIYKTNNGNTKSIKLNLNHVETLLYLKPDNYIKDGVYVVLEKEKIIYIDLIDTDIDLNDFFLPNGRFNDKKYETLSYITGNTIERDSKYFHLPIEPLPKSETNGLEKLELINETFTNLPIIKRQYVDRVVIEDKLYNALLDPKRWPIISLRGRGGIGKTSTALAVLKKVIDESIYDAIIWFSSRDIDFNDYGSPISVGPRILTKKDISDEYLGLIEHPNKNDKHFDNNEYFTKQLSENFFGKCLFVFDNFETIERPIEMFEWLENYIVLPNKILITTRHREFTTDKQIEVEGMTVEEFNKLVTVISNNFKISDLITKKVSDELYKTSQGHPYVVKILLGEIANTKTTSNLNRVFENKDQILQALFERTYDKLKPISQKVFQVLCNWRSIIPEIALEATITCNPLNIDDEIYGFDIQEAIDELRVFSFIEILNPKEEHKFINVPLTASIFGFSKYKTNPNKAEILSYTKLLQNFGASQALQISEGIEPRIKFFFLSSIPQKVLSQEDFDNNYLNMALFICRRFNKAKLFLADLYANTFFDTAKARKYLDEYLRGELNDESKSTQWDRLAGYYKNSNIALYFQTLIEKYEYKGCSIYNLFSVAVDLSKSIKDNKFAKVSKNIRYEIISRLIKMIEQHNSFASITAAQCGYLAWLYVHMSNSVMAKKVARRGLLLGYNKTCQDIVDNYSNLKS